jgi:hypothetical protein
MANYAVIREGYVINLTQWDPEATPNWVYPFPHDSIVLDPNKNAGIGDWYEESEGIFYRPLSVPPDVPEELQNP